MKKILFLIIFITSSFSYSIKDERQLFNTECTDRGNSQKVCDCGFNLLQQRFDLNTVIDAENWLEKNQKLVNKVANHKKPMPHKLQNIIEVLSDYENIADMAIEECKGK